MKTAALLLFAFLMLMFLPRAALVHAQQKPEDLAQKSAEAWLAVTDSGKYAESWDPASASFKAAVSKDNWVGMVSSVRDPLGALQSRKLATAKFVKNPPHAPEGECVILRYDSSFENPLRHRNRFHDSRQRRTMACRRLLRQTAFPMNPMLLTTHSSASPSNSAQRGEALLFVRIRLFGISAHSR